MDGKTVSQGRYLCPLESHKRKIVYTPSGIWAITAAAMLSKPRLPSTGMFMWIFETEIARELVFKFILPITQD